LSIKELHIDFSRHHPHAKIVGRRELLSKDIEGNWATTFKGRGLEFTGYRAYNYTDDASTIDWRASLRSKSLLVREFEEYRNFSVMFLLDVSNSMLFTTTKKLKAEYGAELVYALSQAASDSGEAIGLGLFSDKLQVSFQPAFGKGMHSRFEKTLSNKEYYGGPKDFKKSFLQVNSMLNDKVIMIIVSDFLGLPKKWEKYMLSLASRHHLMGVMIRDKRDRELPPHTGQFVVKDPNTEETMYIDTDSYAKEYKVQSLKQEEYIKKVFKKLRGSCVTIENGADFKKSLEKFFNSHQGMS